MTKKQTLALMLDDAAAQTPCLKLIPILCSLRDLAYAHQDQTESEAVIPETVACLCRLASCEDISKNIPGMVRRLLFQMLAPEETSSQELNLPRQRCCRAAEQIRALQRIRRWYINMLNLWEDAQFRQEETDAFDAQQSAVYEEYERLLLIWKTSIIEHNIERSMEWVRTLEAWNESLPQEEEARNSMENALIRAKLQSESMCCLLECTEKKDRIADNSESAPFKLQEHKH